MSKQQKYMELCLGMDDGAADSLWVRISGQINMAEVVVGRMQTRISKPHLEKVARAFFRQLKEALFAGPGSREGVVTILICVEGQHKRT